MLIGINQRMPSHPTLQSSFTPAEKIIILDDLGNALRYNASRPKSRAIDRIRWDKYQMAYETADCYEDRELDKQSQQMAGVAAALDFESRLMRWCRSPELRDAGKLFNAAEMDLIIHETLKDMCPKCAPPPKSALAQLKKIEKAHGNRRWFLAASVALGATTAGHIHRQQQEIKPLQAKLKATEQQYIQLSQREGLLVDELLKKDKKKQERMIYGTVYRTLSAKQKRFCMKYSTSRSKLIKKLFLKK